MNPKTNWWQRNWKWAAPGGCIGCLGLVVIAISGIALLVFSMIKSSDVYQEGLQWAQASPRVVQSLGEPVEATWLVSGNFQVDDATGDANLSVPLKGPKGSGTLYIEAEKHAGVWDFEVLTVQVDGSSESINLLDSQP